MRKMFEDFSLIWQWKIGVHELCKGENYLSKYNITFSSFSFRGVKKHEAVGWVHVAQDGAWLQAVVNTVVDLQVE